MVRSTQVSGSAAAGYTFQTSFDDVLLWDDFERFEEKYENDLGHTRSSTLDPFLGLPVTVTDANGNTSTTAYDAVGRPLAVKTIFGEVVETTYVSTGLTYQHETSYSGLSVNFVPEMAQMKVTVETPEAPSITKYFGYAGKLIREVRQSMNDNAGNGDTRDIETVFLYDDLGRMVAESLPRRVGDSSNLKWTQVDYDPLGRETSRVLPDGTVRTTTYNGYYNQITTSFPDGVTETTIEKRDSLGNPVENWNIGTQEQLTYTSIPSGDPDIRIEYDAVGNVRKRQRVKNGSNITVTENFYDAKGYQRIRMTDMAMGEWEYGYDSKGRLRWQEDARGKDTYLSYDTLDRPTLKVIDGKVSQFEYYDSTTAEGGSVGALRRSIQYTYGTDSSVVTQKGYFYDSFGRVETELQEIDGKYFYKHFGYHAELNRLQKKSFFWRPKELQDDYTQKPFAWQSYGVKYLYNSRGAMTLVKDSHNKTWWSNPEYDNFGRVIEYTNGNGVRTIHDIDPLTQRVESILSTKSSYRYQDWSYEYTGNGNLESRTDNRSFPGYFSSSQTESYGYNVRNELTKVNGATVNQFDPEGNLTRKKIFGNSSLVSVDYNYEMDSSGTISNGKLSSMSLTTYSSQIFSFDYDANGNLLRRWEGGEIDYEVEWTSFNKPLEVARMGNYERFVYDANQTRIMSISFDGSSPVKQLYISGEMEQIERATSPGSGNYHSSSSWDLWDWSAEAIRIYIQTPSGRIGSLEYDMTAPLGAKLNRRWHHLDRMGNLDCVTYEDDGFPVEGTAYAYDAWGLPRQSAENWGDDGAYNQDTFVWPDESTDRGYTNHEMLETIGLIHMNARLYDPIIGQFISPDSVTPAPMSAQDISRYAYVYNNPFRYIDPSGHSSVSIDWSGQKSLDPVIVKNDDGSFTVMMGKEDAANLSDEDKADLKAAFEKADSAARQNHGTSLYAFVKDSATSSSASSGAEMGALAQAAPESSAKRNAPQETEAAENVDPTDQGGDLKAAHEEAGKILADIDDPDHEYSILIRAKEGGGFSLSDPIQGERASVGDEVMKLLVDDTTIHGIAHLHHTRGRLSPGDLIASLQAGISISAWTTNLEGELFLPSIGRWSSWGDRSAQARAGNQWARNQRADTHYWKGTLERRFVNRPPSAEMYFHSGTRFTYRPLR